MKEIFVLHKQEGETPLERLNRFKHSNKAYRDVPLTYAGRLDPMASGKLLVLAGPKTKEKESYLGLQKEYEFEILFGIATDTGDILGMITSPSTDSANCAKLGLAQKSELLGKIQHAIARYNGFTFEQKYPLFSSKTVYGQPLFMYARKDEVLSAIEHPTKMVTIIDIAFKGSKTISAKALQKDTEQRIAKVTGDFRQEDIVRRWQSRTDTLPDEKYLVVKCRATVTSGTYIRVLAENIGKDIGLPALAYSIKRTKIGDF